MKECMEDISLAEQWHKHFYQKIDWRKDLKYCGVPIFKNPNDLQIIQELIWEVMPAYIIETGTAYGGSALCYTHLMERYGGKVVITIDDSSNSYVPLTYIKPSCPNLHYITGSSISFNIKEYIKNLIPRSQKVLVILDSCHTFKHVLAELDLYKDFVSPGSYLIVEDTNTDLVIEDYGPGPADAVKSFLKENVKFERDVKLEEKFGFSFNTYLRRVVEFID